MKEAVRDRYAKHAVELPASEVPPTLGLGDPVELAALQPGETVLDLGSGPGRDLLEAARQVGPSGRSIGVDFTLEMIERARASAAEAGLENVSILEGDLEHLPVHCGAVDVVISNCVINLVDDKRRALIEAYRALRPGGRFAVLDTAFATEPGQELRESNDSWCSCVGGALVESEYEAILRDIGYEDVKIERIGDGCGGDSCETDSIQSLAVAVTARKPGDAVPTIRPAVPSERVQIETLVGEPVRTEDAIVALDDGRVVGAIVLERWGATSIVRSLAGGEGVDRQLLIAALEVARWSGADEVRTARIGADELFATFGFAPNGEQLVLRFEDADLPLLSKPSLKPLPTFQDGACC